MMRVPIAAFALVAAACTPMPSAVVDPAAPLQNAEAGTCATRGGTMKAVGRMQTMQCIVAYADAGNSCTDGSQCAGDCRAEPKSRSVEGAAVAGTCQVDSDRFGCHSRVEAGKATATICVD